MSEYERVGGGSFWKPETEGDSIEGLYKGKEMSEGKFGLQEIATLETRAGDLKKVSIKAGLKSSFELLSPGRVIKIVYTGKQKNPKSGRIFDGFEVFAVKTSPTEAKAAALAQAAGIADANAEEVPF